MMRFAQIACLLPVIGSTAACGAAGSVESEVWGTLENRPVRLHTLTNARGLVAKVTDYGTILTEMHVPDRDGETADVVLGFDNLASYLKGHPAYGCNVGRVANRIANGQFTIDGKSYAVARNAGKHHIHGGRRGFHKHLWEAEPKMTSQGPSVRFTRTSPDGEEGYPGTLRVAVTYTLTNDDGLRIDYEATTDQSTAVNLAHHSYFNLAGHGAGDVRGHRLRMLADRVAPADDSGLPTGELIDVAGTPFDFNEARRLGRDFEKLGKRRGYDHHFVVRGPIGTKRLAAVLSDPASGRAMQVFVTQPGVQLYTGNGLSERHGGKGATYRKWAGVCLENQHAPDSISHEGEKDWPSVILRPGQTYKHTVEYRFSAR